MIKKIVLAAFVTLLSINVLANAPSGQSISELLTITESKKLLESSTAQYDAMLESAVTQALKGQEMTPEVQHAINNMQQKTLSLIKQEMSWESMEPLFIDIYKKSFSQEEIDGMLAFYRSDAGQAVVRKMPAVMQHTMQVMQSKFLHMMPEMKRIKQEMIAEIQAKKN